MFLAKLCSPRDPGQLDFPNCNWMDHEDRYFVDVLGHHFCVDNICVYKLNH